MTVEIPAWLDAAQSAVERAGDDVQRQRDHDALTDADSVLGKVIPELTRLNAVARRGADVWWVGAEGGSEAIAELDRAKRTLRPEHLKRATGLLKDRAARLSNEVMAAWIDFVTEQTGDADQLKGLMQQLSGAASLADIAQKFNQALPELARLKRQLPDEQAPAILERIRALFDELEQRLPPAIRSFVNAAALAGGAPLDLLDEEVRAWLIENGASDYFRIVVGPSRGGRRG